MKHSADTQEMTTTKEHMRDATFPCTVHEGNNMPCVTHDRACCLLVDKSFIWLLTLAAHESSLFHTYSSLVISAALISHQRSSH
jgi:hypothetical protein